MNFPILIFSQIRNFCQLSTKRHGYHFNWCLALAISKVQVAFAFMTILYTCSTLKVPSIKVVVLFLFLLFLFVFCCFVCLFFVVGFFLCVCFFVFCFFCCFLLLLLLFLFLVRFVFSRFVVVMPPPFEECGRALSVAYVRASVRPCVYASVRLCVRSSII